MTAPRPGFWMVRCCRNCPEVAARVWLCDHEPGEPDNRMDDRPFWQGQIGLELVGPGEILEMVEFCEAPPAEQAAMIAPQQSRREPRNGRAPAFVTAPMAKWKQQRARRISAAEFAAQIRWLLWAERNSPRHPDLNYRKPVAPAEAQIPLFTEARP